MLWLDLSSTTRLRRLRRGDHARRLGGPSLSATSDALEVAFAGDAIMSLDVRGRVTRTDASGSTVLDTVRPEVALAAGFSGSDAGAAWLAAAAP